MSERRTSFCRLSLLAVLASVAACGSDNGGITPPPPPSALVSVSGIPAKGTALQQLGIVLTIHTKVALGSCTFRVDGVLAAGGYCSTPDSAFIIGASVLTPGSHTAEFSLANLGADSAVLIDTSFTFTTIAPKLDQYSAVMLSPLPGDVSASATDMNESGLVVGQSVASDRTSRAVEWVAGQPTALPNENVAYGAATSVNAAGMIAGTLGPSESATVVWTPTDSIITVTDSDPPVRINDAGQVLTMVWSRATDPHYGYLVYDVASGTATQVAAPNAPRLIDFNNKAQLVGYVFGPYSTYGSPVAWQSGGVTFPSVQPAYAPHGGTSTPLDLTDSSKVLLSVNGWTVFGDSASSSVLEPFFGGGGAERANNKDVVAGIGPDSALYLWRKSANVSERIDAGAGWTFDSVQKLNDSGAILAHGTNASTGQSGSVVLTPIS